MYQTNGPESIQSWSIYVWRLLYRESPRGKEVVTLIVSTSYRRNGWRDRNREKVEKAGDAEEIVLTCLRCFKHTATKGSRCDDCRAKREEQNKGRKR